MARNSRFTSTKATNPTYMKHDAAGKQVSAPAAAKPKRRRGRGRR